MGLVAFRARGNAFVAFREDVGFSAAAWVQKPRWPPRKVRHSEVERVCWESAGVPNFLATISKSEFLGLFMGRFP